ncbi:O-antigen ligase family protein [Nonomuraea polychroma]|uniref:O-antigen ligase family protein n=1 Tax=Nonomuraea polychroma TaxID=46176 RepID=UPI003D8C0611
MDKMIKDLPHTTGGISNSAPYFPIALLVIPIGQLGAAVTGSSSPALWAAFSLILFVAAQVLVGARPLRPSHYWVGLLAFLLLCSYVFPSVTTFAPLIQSTGLAEMLTGLGLLAAATASPLQPRKLVNVTALIGGITATYVLIVGDYASGRLEGLGLNCNYMGALLAIPCVAAVARARRKSVWLIPAGVCLVAIFETQSRGAFLATAVGIFIVFVQSRPRLVQAFLTVTAITITALLPGTLDSLAGVVVGDRSESELSHNTATRKAVAEFAIQVIAEHPVRGIGYGLFPSYAAKSPDFGIYMATHNDYLRLAAESGVITLAVFLILIWLGVRPRRSDDLAILRGIVFTYMTVLVFANVLTTPIVSVPFWLSLGCLLAARSENKTANVSPSSAHHNVCPPVKSF